MYRIRKNTIFFSVLFFSEDANTEAKELSDHYKKKRRGKVIWLFLQTSVKLFANITYTLDGEPFCSVKRKAASPVHTNWISMFVFATRGHFLWEYTYVRKQGLNSRCDHSTGFTFFSNIKVSRYKAKCRWPWPSHSSVSVGSKSGLFASEGGNIQRQNLRR